jgi:hypothetical protein
MRLSTTSVLAIALAVCLASCRETEQAPAADPIPQDVGPKQETGNCNNEHLEGTCHFDGIGALGGANPSGPTDTITVRVMHQVEASGRKERITSLYLSLPMERKAELIEYYRKRSPTPCKAYIVRPPCNPNATSANLGFDPPSWAKEERF